MTLREQVEAEALANGYRRETARQDGAANRGLRGPTAARFQVGDRVRQIAAELAAEEEAERRAKMKAPSDLIATANRKWPGQVAAVKAFAEAQGMTLGEACVRKGVPGGSPAYNGQSLHLG